MGQMAVGLGAAGTLTPALIELRLDTGARALKAVIFRRMVAL
jgi:hypothetical protein